MYLHNYWYASCTNIVLLTVIKWSRIMLYEDCKHEYDFTYNKHSTYALGFGYFICHKVMKTYIHMKKITFMLWIVLKLFNWTLTFVYQVLYLFLLFTFMTVVIKFLQRIFKWYPLSLRNTYIKLSNLYNLYFIILVIKNSTY